MNKLFLGFSLILASSLLGCENMTTNVPAISEQTSSISSNQSTKFPPLFLYSESTTVSVGTPLRMVALGGSEPYHFSVNGGATLTPGMWSEMYLSAPNPGTYTVTLTDDYATEPKNVTVVVKGATAIFADGFNSCAKVSSGEVQCWGADPYNILGPKSATFEITLGHSTPQTPSGFATGLTGFSSFNSSYLYSPSQGHTPSEYQHDCYVISGGVQCYGDNRNGQLGNNTLTNSTSLVQVQGLTSGVSQVVSSSSHSCALKTNGTVFCWGDNTYGQLGTGNYTSHKTPIQVVGLSSATQISVGGLSTCAVDSGGVKCWGDNTFGELGNNSTVGDNSNVPVSVSGLTSGVSQVVSTKNAVSCAVVAGGVQCWGVPMNSGSVSPLSGTGVSATVTPLSVVGMGPGSGVTKLSAGSDFVCAIKNNGAYCWGESYEGELGNGSFNGSNTPVSVSGLTTGVADLSSGLMHTCAMLSNGAVKCWGDNTYGQLGNGGQSQPANRPQPSPVYVSSWL